MTCTVEVKSAALKPQSLARVLTLERLNLSCGRSQVRPGLLRGEFAVALAAFCRARSRNRVIDGKRSQNPGRLSVSGQDWPYTTGRCFS